MIEILLRRVSNYDHSFICGDRSLQEEIHAVTQESLQVDKDQLEKEVRQLNKQISQLQVFKCISKIYFNDHKLHRLCFIPDSLVLQLGPLLAHCLTIQTKEPALLKY